MFLKWVWNFVGAVLAHMVSNMANSTAVGLRLSKDSILCLSDSDNAIPVYYNEGYSVMTTALHEMLNLCHNMPCFFVLLLFHLSTFHRILKSLNALLLI